MRSNFKLSPLGVALPLAAMLCMSGCNGGGSSSSSSSNATSASNSMPGTTMAALGYDAMMVTCEALKSDKSNDSKGLIVALNDLQGYKGVSGDITLKGNGGNPPKRALVVTLDPKVGGNGQKFVKAYNHDDLPVPVPPPTGNRPAPTSDGNKIDGDTIPIGVVASLSGDLLPWGQDELKGAQIAVDEVNAAGGINGKKIDLKYEDSQSKPEQGKSAAEKLISEGAIGLVGEVSSGITAQIAQAAFEKGIPVVAVGATKTDLTQLGTNVVRVCYTDDFQGPVMATFAYKELGLRHMALVTDRKQPYSTFLSQKFRDYFTKLGGTIVDEEFYQSGDTQFKGILTNIKAKNPDGLFMSGYFPEVGPLARQASEVGLKVPMMGGDGWDSKDILNGGGSAIVGGYFCNHYNNLEDRPEVKSFLAKWAKKYPQ